MIDEVTNISRTTKLTIHFTSSENVKAVDFKCPHMNEKLSVFGIAEVPHMNSAQYLSYARLW